MSSYSDFSRIRSIAQKRINRLSEAGFIKPYKIPTVADIKSGKADLEKLTKSIEGFLSSGNVLKQVRKQGITPNEFVKPKPKRERKPLTKEQREKKNARARERYKEKKEELVKKSIDSDKQRILKSAKTVIENWKKSGLNLGGKAEKILTDPKTAQAFIEYIDYRFSQGDFNMMYVIDDFVEDFIRMLNKGFSADDILSDFNTFLTDRADLENSFDNMHGVSAEESLTLWDRFIND